MKPRNSAITGRLRTSFVTTIISISLVLFLVGILGLLALNANTLSRYVKENIGFTVFLKDGIKEVEMQRLQKNIGIMQGVKSTRFVSKEEAASILQKELGEDFVEFIGYNPLPPSIDIKFHYEYASSENLDRLEKQLLAYPEVKEVFYQKSLIQLVNENVQKISMVLSGFVIMLLFICIVLINNTIRLSIYSKRFIIRTMQLVGATRGFINGPFVLKGALNGIIGAFVSLLMLSGVIYFLQQDFKEIASYIDFELLGILYLSVVLLGIIITAISTYFAVNKYLMMKTDNLYI
mgnify:CR=1 FL=1